MNIEIEEIGNINCPSCENEVTLNGILHSDNNDHWIEGICMKCGWTITTDTNFLEVRHVNDWRDCQEKGLTMVDELYLYSNRYKKVSTKEKMLELGWFKEEEIEKWKDFHNSSQCSKSLPWDFSVHKGNLNREYGKLKRIQEYEELKEEGEKINDQRGLKVLEESYKDVLEEVS